MDLNQIKQILELVREHELSEFEVEHDGLRLKIRKDINGAHVVTLPAPAIASGVVTAAGAAPSAAAGPVAAAAPSAAAPSAAEAPAESEIELAVVKSPIVGTFYRSASPQSEPFVNVGDRVEPETVVCIIEAMKLMNEIQAEINGVVTDIYVQNGQPVEYGQPLFGIKT